MPGLFGGLSFMPETPGASISPDAAAQGDPGQAELERLLASLEMNPTPAPPPRIGAGRSILGALGDALTAAGRVRAGGMPPESGAFASSVAAQQKAYEDAMMQGEAANRELRNRVKVGAFEMKQRSDAAKAKAKDDSDEAARQKAEQQMGLLQTANAMVGQIPQLTAQGEELAKVIEGRGGNLNLAMANRVRQSIQGLEQFRQRITTMPPEQITPQLLTQMGQTKNDVDALLNSMASQLSQQDAGVAIGDRAIADADRATAKSEAKNIGSLQRTQAVFPEIASMAQPLLARLDKVGADDYSAQIRGEIGILDRRIKDGLENPTETSAVEAAKQADDLRRIMAQARVALGRQDAERAKKRELMQKAKAQISKLTEYLDAVDDAQKFVTDNPGTGGFVMGRVVPDIFSKNQDTLNVKYTKISATLVHALSGGAVPQDEYTRLKPLLPLVNNTEGQQQVRLDEQKRAAMGNIAAKATEFGLSQADVDAIIKAQRTGKIADLNGDDLSPVRTVPVIPMPPGFDAIGGASIQRSP